MKNHQILAALAVCVAATAVADLETLLDLPIAGVANTAYLTSASERPWWNKDWTRRAPLLVSSQAKVSCGKALVDVIVDFGEEVKPEDVRVVTMWETLVDCVCEKVESKSRVEVEERKDSALRLGLQTSTSSTALRLLFLTPLRIEENKPFLVYWGRKVGSGDVARASSPLQNGQKTSASQGGDALATMSSPSPVTFTCSSSEVVLDNGILHVVFDNDHKTTGLLKQIRVNASQTPNELQWRATGYAWEGFRLNAGGWPQWSKAIVVEDNAFKKTIRFDSDRATIDFSLAAGQSRIDWAYTLKDPRCEQSQVGISWSCGDGTGEDNFFYRGSSGKILSFRASLDCCTDNIPSPYYEDIAGWMSEGWYAIRDRVQKEVVGMLFDRAALARFEYCGAGQHAGERPYVTFRHEKAKKSQGGDALTTKSAAKCSQGGDALATKSAADVARASSPLQNGGSALATVKGALVATLGDVNEVTEEYARWVKPPRVFVGKSEAYREIPYRRPRLDHDFCADFNIGKGSGAGWESGEPLEGTEWASNIIDHIRSYGANAVRVGGYNWYDLPITKEQYDRCVAAQRSPLTHNPKCNVPAWGAKGYFTGEKFREYVDAAHGKGLAFSLWTGFCPGIADKRDFQWQPEFVQLDLELQNIYADLGADAIYNARACREGIDTPEADYKKYGSAFWKWENPQVYFDWEDKRTEVIKDFYRESKKRHPDVPVIIMNSEASIMERETQLSDQAGFVDAVYCEMLPWCDSPHTVPHTKQVVKRLRALWDNEAGRTVHSHFYYYGHSTRYRIRECELPFVCGANGFTFENLTYENFGYEQPQITADFYRLLEYTKLGDKVARMAPVKNLAVFRDNKAFKDDVRKHRKGKPYDYMSQQDGRVNGFAEIPSYNYDIVVDKFFTAEALAKYRVVYVPEDEAFSEKDAAELIAYVKAGGGAVVEGATCQGEDALATKNGAASSCGEDALATKNGAASSCGKGALATKNGAASSCGKDALATKNGAASSCGKGVLALAKLGLKDGVITSLGKGKIVWVKEILTDRLAKRDKKAFAEVKKLVRDLGGIEPFTMCGLNGQECPFSGERADHLDANLQASDEGLFLGVFHRGNDIPGGTVKGPTATGVVKIGERTLLSVRGTRGKGVPALADGKSASDRQGGDALATKPYYVLNVRTGERQALTNGTFTVTVPNEQAGFYLIGDDAFTALPATRECAWTGAALSASRPKGAAVNTRDLAGFVQHKAVELVPFGKKGPVTFRRTRDAQVDALYVDGSDFDARTVGKYLDTASYVLVSVPAEKSDILFATFGEKLRALLARGGAIQFNKSAPGPKAQAFLDSVGVFNPYTALTKDTGDNQGKWSPSVSTNDPCFYKSVDRPSFLGLNCEEAGFAKWDAAKQVAPIVCSLKPEVGYLVCQENVAGKGMVIFNQMRALYTDWYENKELGRRLHSLMLGMDEAEHAKLVQFVNGGPGEVRE